MDTADSVVDDVTDGTTLAIPPIVDEGPSYSSYSTADFFIGLGITLGASTLQALGLNLTKLDHKRNESIPRSQRKPDYLRVSRQDIVSVDERS